MTATLGYASDWQVGQWMNELLIPKLSKTGRSDDATSFVSLHSANPSMAPGTSTNTEVQGGGYHRSGVWWAKADARVLTSANALEWLGLPEVWLTFLGIYTGDTSGELRAIIPMTEPLYVKSDGIFRLKAGDLYLRWP